MFILLCLSTMYALFVVFLSYGFGVFFFSHVPYYLPYNSFYYFLLQSPVLAAAPDIYPQ